MLIQLKEELDKVVGNNLVSILNFKRLTRYDLD